MRFLSAVNGLALLFGIVSVISAADVEWQDEEKTWTIKGTEMSCNNGTLVAKIEASENLVITGRVKIDSSNTDPQKQDVVKAAIFFQHQKTAEADTYYSFAFRPKSITLYRFVVTPQEAKYLLLGQQKIPTPLSKWIKFKIEVARGRIQIAFSLPPNLTITATDPTPLPAGGIQLVSTDCAVTFKDIKIKTK